MARYSAGARTTAGSTVLPIISLYAGNTVNFHIVEIGVFNTTSTAVALKLGKLSTVGTQGTGLTESNHDESGAAASCAAFNTHSGSATVSADLGYNTTLPAQVGAGVIWTFGGRGLSVAAGTANGVGVIVATGTGQACDAYIVWEE